jgi:hypothetical protein
VLVLSTSASLPGFLAFPVLYLTPWLKLASVGPFGHSCASYENWSHTTLCLVVESLEESRGGKRERVGPTVASHLSIFLSLVSSSIPARGQQTRLLMIGAIQPRMLQLACLGPQFKHLQNNGVSWEGMASNHQTIDY